MNNLDDLKLIPQVFFDLIARVIPGAAAIIAWQLISGQTLQSSLERTFGTEMVTGSPILAFVMFLLASYVAGQLLSPVAKMMQRVGEKLPPKPSVKLEGAYDSLRLHHPAAGALAAKIRAEFTMHNGLSSVFLLSAVVYPIYNQNWRWSILLGLIFFALLTAYRGRTTRDTFNETVIKFDNAVKELHPPEPAAGLVSNGESSLSTE